MRRAITRSLGLGTAALLAATAPGGQPGSASGPTGWNAGKAGGTATSVNRAIDGADRAARWFRALTAYMTSGTTYAQARRATLNAATDLFGSASTQRATVGTAWSAVSVN